MTDRLLVLLDDQVAGAVDRDRAGRLTFSYDDSYRASPVATPLSVSMPLQVRVHPDRIVTPWLWGLLPDNDRVLQRWAERFHASASSPFALLATPVGQDCAGAVRFVREDALVAALDRPGEVQWLDDDEIAARLRDLRNDSTAWLGSDFAGRFTLAGAQAKTALLQVDGQWGLPSGALPTSHILKPAIVGLDDHHLNEHVCMRAAAYAGLLVARTEVIMFGDECAVVVERYDRSRLDDGSMHRLHQEDVLQALALHPTNKYQADGGPAPGTIASLLRRIMPPRVADGAIAQFLDGLLWNWIIGGTDAHAKNYSVLLLADDVRLAPLYDIASALPYAHERQLRLAMKLGGDYRLHTQRASTWADLAAELGVDVDRARNRAMELASAAPQAFGRAAAEIGEVRSDMPTRIVELIAARAERCAQAAT